MQIIGMIGYVDKYDFVINLAKTINMMGKTVLVVDATLDKKLKYIIPTLSIDEKCYITQYDNIDFAVGFDSIHDLESYTADQRLNISLYDYIILDIDNPKYYEFFRTRGIDKMYFFIDTSVISLNKNQEILKAMKVYNTTGQALQVTRVLYKSYLTRASEHYFEKKLAGIDVNWNNNNYVIPNEEQDKMANIDAQISGIVDIRKHTRIFIETIADMASEILGDTNSKEVMKKIKRG
ncbi:MAG: hypothetical protein N2749_07020 [Clostridia bacterium]|nr:hypothetical protein [Clostridia bacterium]